MAIALTNVLTRHKKQPISPEPVNALVPISSVGEHQFQDLFWNTVSKTFFIKRKNKPDASPANLRGIVWNKAKYVYSSAKGSTTQHEYQYATLQHPDGPIRVRKDVVEKAFEALAPALPPQPLQAVVASLVSPIVASLQPPERLKAV
jgi:hypothetical protein